MVKVEALGLRGMITLRCDMSTVGAVAEIAVPAVGQMTTVGDRVLAWMSPDEVMLLLPHAEVAATLADISLQFQGVHHLALDVSDARAMFSLSGPGVRDVVAKLAPVDLHPDHFGPGQFRRSRLGQVAAAFWMTGSGDITLICFRSVAGYVFALLEQSAKDGPVGYYA